MDNYFNFNDPTRPPITLSLKTLLVGRGSQHFESKNVSREDQNQYFIKKWLYRNLKNGDRVSGLCTHSEVKKFDVLFSMCTFFL